MLATIVETEELLKTIAASLIAGVGVTALFSILIVAATRFAEGRREDRPLVAAAFGLLTGLAMAAVAAAIVFGIIVMTTKS